MNKCLNGSILVASKKYPPADRESHDTFCVTEGWTLVRGATGKPVTHHRTYELTLWDGRILRTRISRPINSSQYGTQMWSHILKQQLEVTVEEFWSCVNDGQLPDRGFAPLEAPPQSIPLFLLKELMKLGVSEKEALAMTPAQAAEKRVELLAASIIQD
jgi:hypothetical protein